MWKSRWVFRLPQRPDLAASIYSNHPIPHFVSVLTFICFLFFLAMYVLLGLGVFECILRI
jgi:hypothetical protein